MRALCLGSLGARLPLLLALVACGGAQPWWTPSQAISQADRERIVREHVDDALAFRAQGRLESAEASLRRGLAVDPDSPRALRLLAIVLEELARDEEAEGALARAARLDPPPPPPPDEPFPVRSGRLLVVLPPPPRGAEEAARIQGGWPEGEAAVHLQRRLRTRLPEAELVLYEPTTVPEAQYWLAEHAPDVVLSLRLERAFCGDSQKDGPFAVAWLRAATAAPGGAAGAPEIVRESVLWPERPSRCVQIAVGRALEDVLALPDVRASLALPGTPGVDWSARSVRALFPGFGPRIAEWLERGRARMATGRLDEALDAFRHAAAIDPEDANVNAYLAEVELTLALARELAERDSGAMPDAEPQEPYDFVLTPAERAAAESLLAQERRLRDELLAVLSVAASGSGVAPSASVLATLRPVTIPDPLATGPMLAQERAQAPIEARALFTPDGDVVARYYFAAGTPQPLLREDDLDGDGDPDYWVAFQDGRRREVWEDRLGLARPNLHFVFEPGGGPLERVEIDSGADGFAERVFRYAEGRLVAEERDTDDDHRLDRFDHFDEDGVLVRRDEDLDGNGSIDVRSHYRDGSLIRREILDPELLQQYVKRN